MHALVFNEEGLQYKTDYQTPLPKDNESLVRITHAGICGTDLEIIKGYMNFSGIPGHEFVGVVEKSDDPTLLNKRVVGEINIDCNSCRFCQNGLSTHCPNRSVLGILKKDGAFCEYLTLPSKNLHTIPDSVSDEEAVFVEPLAAAFEILNQFPVKSHHKVCILGDGKLGIISALLLSNYTDHFITIGHHSKKLSLLENRGIQTSKKSSPFSRSFDVVVDCTGSAQGLVESCRLVKPRGTVIIKTTSVNRETIDFNQIVIDEITLIGSRCGPFDQAINALFYKQIDLKPLISKTFPLSMGKKAFDLASKKSSLKVILKATNHKDN